MDKLGRAYKLEIELENGDILTLALPFTIEFDITRNTLTSANVCQIRIFNLGLKNRNQIRFNQSNFGKFRAISLKAGYGTNLPVVFSGNISQAWSVREGTNFITQIECYDGGFAFLNGHTSVAFPAATNFKDAITTLAGTLPKVTIGAIGNYPGTLGRGNSMSGNTMQILSELTGGGAFIDKSKFYALGTNEYVENVGAVPIINSASGLLGTPVLEQTLVRFDMVFEPRLFPGQKIFLESITEANFNGDYKVTGVKHRGMISDAVCGECITTGEFFFTKILSPVSTQ